jgi:hypothetical protein
VYKYKLRWADGSDAGEHECSSVIHPHEIVWIGGGRRLHVLEVMPVEAGSPFVALLRVARADGPASAENQPPA